MSHATVECAAHKGTMSFNTEYCHSLWLEVHLKASPLKPGFGETPAARVAITHDWPVCHRAAVKLEQLLL
jgi:hypothetical protein